MAVETGLTRNKILSELSKSPHGKLSEYLEVGQKAARQESEFFAHLIAWDRIKGQVRDAKVALPVVALSVSGMHPELEDNALAHLALLGPREILRAYRFALEVRLPGKMRRIERLLSDYLHDSEGNWKKWCRMAIQHRATLKELYSLAHVRPNSEQVNIVLFGRTFDKVKTAPPKGSIFETVSRLKDMSPTEAAGTIMENRIPFLIARGALGAKAKEPDLVLALIKSMSSSELVNNSKTLEKLGMKTNPALRAAYEEGIAKASTSTKNVLKATVAAEAVEDEGLKVKLRALQERQINAFGGVEGNWLVLGDRSPSMRESIQIATEVAGTLAKLVKGNVYLVFFDSSPQTMDVTGLSLDEIKKKTRHIAAGGGGTSIGCGLQRMLESSIEIDGIAIVSDAQENTAPAFVYTYQLYMNKFDKQVPVYLYRCSPGSRGYSDIDLAESMRKGGFDLQEFDMRGKTDYYALPDLAQTMRVNRFSLLDEIMAVPLLSLKDVLKS